MTRSSRFGRVVVALRWPIALAWIAAAALATALLPSIKESQTGALGDLVPNDAAAIDAELRSAQLFGFPLLSRTIVVQRDPDGLSAAAQASTVSRAVALNRNTLPGLDRVGGAIPVLNTVSIPPFTRERGTTAITYLFFEPEVGAAERIALAERVAERARAIAPGTFTGVTGALPARETQSELISDRLPLVELCTVLLVLVAVGVHYRAPLAPLLTLLAIAVTYLITVRAVAWTGQRAGVAVPSEVQPVIVVLLFGILTDYAIFFLSRFRLRLSEGAAARAAAERAAGELVGTIVAAGLTVAAASAALIVAELGFFQTFGPGVALAVLLALAVAVTFIPALLAIVGDATFWPSRPGREIPAERGAEETPTELTGRPVRSRALRAAGRHPALTAVACATVLLAAASGLTRIDVGQTLIRGLPRSGETHQAYIQAAQGFTPGVLSPTTVLVEAPGIVERRPALRRLQRAIDRLPGVALVVGPAQQRLDRELGAVFSRSADAVRYLVVFRADPLGAGGDRPPANAARAAARADGGRRAGRRAHEHRGRHRAGRGDGAAHRRRPRRVAPVALLADLRRARRLPARARGPFYLVASSVLALAASLGSHRLRLPGPARLRRADLLRALRRRRPARRPRVRLQRLPDRAHLAGGAPAAVCARRSRSAARGRRRRSPWPASCWRSASRCWRSCPCAPSASSRSS